MGTSLSGLGVYLTEIGPKYQFNLGNFEVKNHFWADKKLKIGYRSKDSLTSHYHLCPWEAEKNEKELWRLFIFASGTSYYHEKIPYN